MLDKVIADKEVMRCSIDLDWCTYHCPCGNSMCTRFESDSQIINWVELHKLHTNGKVVEHTTPNGRRAWGG